MLVSCCVVLSTNRLRIKKVVIGFHAMPWLVVVGSVRFGSGPVRSTDEMKQSLVCRSCDGCCCCCCCSPSGLSGSCSWLVGWLLVGTEMILGLGTCSVGSTVL